MFVLGPTPVKRTAVKAAELQLVRACRCEAGSSIEEAAVKTAQVTPAKVPVSAA